MAETAFVLPLPSLEGSSHSCRLRRFTPNREVPLCGHATLASAHVLFSDPGAATEGEESQVYTFQTLSGALKAVRLFNEYIELDFPADNLESVEGDRRAVCIEKVKRAVLGQAEVASIWQGRIDVVV